MKKDLQKSQKLPPSPKRGSHESKTAFYVFLVLHVVTLMILVRGAMLGRSETVFTACLALLLLLVPSILERSLRIELPGAMEILAYLFVFASAILGEIGNFYQQFPLWDSLLHGANGFLFAAFGFCLFDLFDRKRHNSFSLSPAFLSLVAFSFSMTIGVFWEFFEFAADRLLFTDMQKDTLQHSIHSVTLPGLPGEKVAHVSDITSTVIHTASGESITVAGYLDIGLVDTMKDLLINLVGALIFTLIGYSHFKHRQKRSIAAGLIPKVK